jgi:hypothetical protein
LGGRVHGESAAGLPFRPSNVVIIQRENHERVGPSPQASYWTARAERGHTNTHIERHTHTHHTHTHTHTYIYRERKRERERERES